MGNSFSDAAMLIFGAVCQQGAYVIPYTISGRIIIIFSFVSLMFLYTSYSANIVALLQSSSTSIQTLDDLLNSRLRVGVDDTVFNRFYFPVILSFTICLSPIYFKQFFYRTPVSRFGKRCTKKRWLRPAKKRIFWKLTKA